MLYGCMKTSAANFLLHSIAQLKVLGILSFKLPIPWDVKVGESSIVVLWNCYFYVRLAKRNSCIHWILLSTCDMHSTKGDITNHATHCKETIEYVRFSPLMRALSPLHGTFTQHHCESINIKRLHHMPTLSKHRKHKIAFPTANHSGSYRLNKWVEWNYANK